MPINERNIAFGLLKGGSRAYDVARRFGCNERTIYRLQQHVGQTGSINDLPRSGRPRITTPRQDKYMVTSSSRHRIIPAKKILQRLREAMGTRISVYTDRNRLRAARVRAQRRYISVLLTQRHRVACLDWVSQGWNRVVFTDESKFNLIWADGRVRVWSPRGKR